MDGSEQAFCTDFVCKALCAVIDTHKHHDRFSYYVIKWNIPPVSCILRVVTVISHHPIIILKESIFCNRISVKQYVIVVYLYFVVFPHFSPFIYFYNRFIEWDCFWSNAYGCSFLWNVNRAKVVYVPSIATILREDTIVYFPLFIGDRSNAFYVWIVLKMFVSFIGHICLETCVLSV